MLKWILLELVQHFAGGVKVIWKITEECKMPEIIKNDVVFRTLEEKSICQIPYFLNLIIWEVLLLWQLQLNHSVLAQNAFSTSICFFYFFSFSISFKWNKSKWTLKSQMSILWYSYLTTSYLILLMSSVLWK